MYRSSVRVGLLAGAVIAALLPALRADDPPILKDSEIPVLRALLVADTDANIGESCAVDRDRVRSLLKQGFETRPTRLDLTILDGKNATPEKVRDHYSRLLKAKKVQPHDTLAFYYAGHGDSTKADGHRLTMAAGKLNRKDLLTAMRECKPRLAVVLTDCCSKTAPGVKAKAVPVPPVATWPVMDCLFFNHRGVTDINGCQEDAFSWCYVDKAGNDCGGTFTLALVPLLCSRLDAFGGAFVTWGQFATGLQKDTDAHFQAMWAAAGPSEPIKDQKAQKPQVFSLAEKAEQKVVDPYWFFGATVGPARRGGAPGSSVEKVSAGSPADKAGLRAKDLILALGGRPTPTPEDFARAIDRSATEEILVEYEREGKTNKMTVTMRPVKPPKK